MYPKLWQASGLGYTDLITRLIELALERHAADSALKPVCKPAGMPDIAIGHPLLHHLQRGDG